MGKFWAVVKREYFKVVWTKVFLISTLLAPVGMILLSFLPIIFFSIKGDAVRLAIVDDNGKIFQRLQENLSPEKQLEKLKQSAEDPLKNLDVSREEQLKKTAGQFGSTFVLEQIKLNNRSAEQIQTELNQRIASENLDAYLIIPPNYDAKDSQFEFFARNSSDMFSQTALQNAVNDAIRFERLSKINISEEKLKEVNQKVNFSSKAVDKTGIVKEGNNYGFEVAFGLAFLLYIMITIYGSAVMGAVIEEKETKIAEILFSSTSPFSLMMGKLVGVCLAGLTQVGIWIFSLLGLLAYFAAAGGVNGMNFPLPEISIGFVIYFFIFFLVGFFLFSTIFALIGSMVTTTQEGSQFLMIVVMILMVGMYSVIPIVRDPNSTFSTLISLAPFVSPISMPARIFIETPPFWQILLSLILNILAICGFVWAAARVYRIGMLMYGKRATIPEVLRWIRTN